MKTAVSISSVEASSHGCTYCIVREGVQESGQSRLQTCLGNWECSSSESSKSITDEFEVLFIKSISQCVLWREVGLGLERNMLQSPKLWR